MNTIEVNSLQYNVAGKQILRDVSLDVMQGEILAVMGMSGSGKTTLLKCLSGLRRPTSGQIRIDGEDIVPMNETALDKIRMKIGLVFQYSALFDSLSVYDNVSFGLTHHQKLSRKEIDDAVEQRLSEVGMEGTEKLFPSELSGGMQKRVGLARALAMKPHILLYDEPTSGLDPIIARSIDELIVNASHKHGVTSVVVSHDILSIFRIADHIAMIDAGAIITIGTPDEIRASDDPKVREFIRT